MSVRSEFMCGMCRLKEMGQFFLAGVRQFTTAEGGVIFLESILIFSANLIRFPYRFISFKRVSLRVF